MKIFKILACFSFSVMLLGLALESNCFTGDIIQLGLIFGGLLSSIGFYYLYENTFDEDNDTEVVCDEENHSIIRKY